MKKSITVKTKAGMTAKIISETSTETNYSTRVEFTHPVIGNWNKSIKRTISERSGLHGIKAGIQGDKDIFLSFLEPEIKEIEAYFSEIEQAIAAAKLARLEAAIADGTAFRTLEIASQYGSELRWARRFRDDEKEKYSEWYREYGMVSMNTPDDLCVKVQNEAAWKIVDSRASDGSFLGCDNQAWIVTEDEWNQIIALSKEIDEQKKTARKKYEEAEAADYKRKIETGYCFNCETWCYGDCGNYRTEPNIQREISQMVTEQNYGILEGE